MQHRDAHGDAILFVDGYGHALKIADKGYPGMGVQEPDSEKVIRGSKEGLPIPSNQHGSYP